MQKYDKLNNSNLIIKNNARKDEIKAYFLLKDILLNDKNVIVGDDIANKLPDIYSEDKKIGIEVTSLEHIAEFIKEKYNLSYKKPSKNYKDIVDYYENLSLKDKNILFNNEFEILLEKKMKKKTNYASCENISLIIISDNEKKPYIRRESLVEIYRKLCIKYNKKYDNLFFYYNDTLYVNIYNDFVKIKKFNFNKGEDLWR